MSFSPTASTLPDRKPSVDRTANYGQQEKIMDGEPCPRDCSTGEGRNLVICIDGTSNKFGQNNTHIVELYSQLVKDRRQLTYYNSGIGTYASPSWKSFAYLKQTLENKIDLAIAWTFERIVISAYRWLAENYTPGDRIFLFGFSRGAYQVRALAGMIEKVGLIHKGNEDQIPFAWEIYSDHKSHELESTNASGSFKEKLRTFSSSKRSKRSTTVPQDQTPEIKEKQKSKPLANRFKETFSRDIHIHFVGVLDTVSSVGLIRGRTLPGTDDPNHICFFRHALALDERRVKFLPEYARGGVCLPGDDEKLDPKDNAIPPSQRVKEIWFAGTHSDIGGGNIKNADMDRSGPPLLWISYEGIAAGLLMNLNRVEWKSEQLGEVHESLKGAYKLLEILPITHQSYKSRDHNIRRLHLGKGRQIQPGQKVHASVAFSKKYTPKAVFPKGLDSPKWDDLIRSDNVTERVELNDTSGWMGWLEMDIFDESAASTVVVNLEKSSIPPLMSIYRLTMLTRSAEGCRAILKVPNAPLRVFRALSKVQSLENRVDQYEIDIVDALVRFAPEYGITCLDEVDSAETVIRLLRNPAFHECVRRFVPKFYQGNTYKAFVLMRFYDQLADALEARKPITEDFFIDKLRDFVDHNNTQEVVDTTLGDLMRMLDNEETRRLSLTCLRELPPHEAWREKINLEKILPRLKDDDVQQQRLAILTIEQSMRLGISSLGNQIKLEIKLLGEIVDLLERTNDLEVQQAAIYALRTILFHSVSAFFGTKVNYLAEVAASKLISVMPKILTTTSWAVRHSVVELMVDMLEHDDSRDKILTQDLTKVVSLLSGDRWEVRCAAFALIVEMRTYPGENARLTEALLKAIPRGDLPAKTDITLDEVFDVILHGSMLYQSTDDKGHIDDDHEFHAELFENETLRYLNRTLQSKERSTRRSSLMTTFALLNFDDIGPNLLERGLVEYLFNMLQESDGSRRQSVVDTLAGLARYQIFREGLLKADHHDIRTLPLKLDTESVDVRRSLLKAIIALANFEDLRTNLLHANLVGCLYKIVQTEDKDECHSAISALVEMAKFDDVRRELLDRDVIDSLVRRLSHAPEIVRSLLWELAIPLAKYDELRRTFLQTELVDFLIRLARAPGTHGWTSSAEALSRLSDFDDIRSALLEEGLIEILADKLRDDEGPVWMPFGFLTYYISNPVQKDRDEVARAPTIKVLYTLSRHADVRKSLLNTSIVYDLCKMLRDRDDDVRNASAEAFIRLARHADMRNRVLDGKNVILLVNMMRNEEDFARVSAAEVIAALAENDHFRTKVLSTNIVNDFPILLQEQGPVRKSILNTLMALVKFDDVQTKLLEAEVIHDLFHLYFEVTTDLRKSFLEVIIALATIHELRSKVLKVNTVGQLVSKMQDRSEDVRRASADAIVELAQFDNVRAQLLEAGVIEYIVDALRVGDSSAKIMSLRATIALAKYGDARQIFTEASIISDLFTLFRGTNWVIWLLSIRAISSLENHVDDARSPIRSADLIAHDYEIWDNTSVAAFGLAFKCIMEMSHDKELRSRLLQVDAVKHFADLFEEPEVRMQAVQAIATLAQYNESGKQIQEANVVDRLVKTIQLVENLDEKTTILKNLKAVAGSPSVRGTLLDAKCFRNILEFKDAHNVPHLSTEIIFQMAILDKDHKIQRHMSEEDAIKFFLEKSTNRDRFQRQFSINLIGKLAAYETFHDAMVKMEIVHKVVEKYKDDDLHVRRAAVEAMAQLAKYAKLNDNSPRYVIRSLIDLLEDDDETIRHECIECISESPAYDNCQSDITDAGLLEFILELLQDESQKKREGSLQAISILSKFADFRKLLSKTYFVITMVGILRDHNWTDCYHLLRAVTELIKYEELRSNIFKSSFISSFIATLGLFYSGSETLPKDILEKLPPVLSECLSGFSSDSEIKKKMERAGLTDSLRDKVFDAAANAPSVLA